jgi:hypothetical protein
MTGKVKYVLRQVITIKRGNVNVTEYSGTFVQPRLWWKSYKYYILWVRVCSLRYAACNVHAPYCIVIWLYNIFLYLINVTILKKRLLNLKCVYLFSLQIMPETFLILRKIGHYVIVNVNWSSYKVPINILRFYWNLNFLDRFSEKLNHQISWKSVHWEQSCFRQIDTILERQTDRTKLLVVFRNFVYATKKRAKFKSCVE